MLDRTGQALGEKSLNIEGKEVTIKTAIGDVRKYLKTTQRLRDENKNEAIIDAQFDLLEKLVKQGNPDEEENYIKQFVEENFAELLKESLIALRLVKRKDYETEEDTKN